MTSELFALAPLLTLLVVFCLHSGTTFPVKMEADIISAFFHVSVVD